MDDRDRYGGKVMRDIPQRRKGELHYVPGKSEGVWVARRKDDREVEYQCAYIKPLAMFRTYPASSMLEVTMWVAEQYRWGRWCSMPEVIQRFPGPAIHIRSWRYK